MGIKNTRHRNQLVTEKLADGVVALTELIGESFVFSYRSALSPYNI